MPRFFFWLSIILLIFFRYLSSRPVYHDGDKIRISARVTSEPVRYSDRQYLRLLALKIYLPKYPEIYYGDRVVIEGRVENGKLVDARLDSHQARQGNLLYGFRQKLISFYKSNLPEPHASLVSGVVLGSKNMPQSFWDGLVKTGTAHVVVASGMNVTLVASFLISFLALLLPRKKAIPAALVGIWGYAALSGFDAPIIRAAIMGSIVFITQQYGRVISAWRVLLYCATLMLIFKPAWLTDLGFILSFVATACLLLFQKRIDDKLKFVPSLLREGLSTSLAAQIGVAPIFFATFGRFSLLSPVINALVLWTVPYLMILGALGGMAGLSVPLVGRLILLISYPLTWWFVEVVQIFG